MKSQEDLEKQQKEIKGAVKTLKVEVKGQMRTGLRDLSQAPPEPLEDLEATFKAERRLQNEWESLKENYPFAANVARTLSLVDKLDLSKVHITVNTILYQGAKGGGPPQYGAAAYIEASRASPIWLSPEQISLFPPPKP